MIAALALSCRTPERELVDRFLEASRRKDDQTVWLLSLVAFPGEVTDYRVVSLGEERREPFRLTALRERVEEAEKRRNEQYKLFSAFRQANYDELLRVQRILMETPGTKLEGRQGELEKQWEAFRAEQLEKGESLREAQRALESEIRRVQKSLQREAAPEDLAGETLTKDASVRVTTTGEGERPYVVTLTRYDVKNRFGAVVPTRWIVTAVSPS